MVDTHHVHSASSLVRVFLRCLVLAAVICSAAVLVPPHAEAVTPAPVAVTGVAPTVAAGPASEVCAEFEWDIGGTDVITDRVFWIIPFYENGEGTPIEQFYYYVDEAPGGYLGIHPDAPVPHPADDESVLFLPASSPNSISTFVHCHNHEGGYVTREYVWDAGSPPLRQVWRADDETDDFTDFEWELHVSEGRLPFAVDICLSQDSCCDTTVGAYLDSFEGEFSSQAEWMWTMPDDHPIRASFGCSDSPDPDPPCADGTQPPCDVDTTVCLDLEPAGLTFQDWWPLEPLPSSGNGSPCDPWFNCVDAPCCLDQELKQEVIGGEFGNHYAYLLRDCSQPTGSGTVASPWVVTWICDPATDMCCLANTTHSVAHTTYPSLNVINYDMSGWWLDDCPQNPPADPLTDIPDVDELECLDAGPESELALVLASLAADPTSLAKLWAAHNVVTQIAAENSQSVFTGSAHIGSAGIPARVGRYLDALDAADHMSDAELAPVASANGLTPGGLIDAISQAYLYMLEVMDTGESAHYPEAPPTGTGLGAQTLVDWLVEQCDEQGQIDNVFDADDLHDSLEVNGLLFQEIDGSDEELLGCTNGSPETALVATTAETLNLSAVPSDVLGLRVAESDPTTVTRVGPSAKRTAALDNTAERVVMNDHVFVSEVMSGYGLTCALSNLVHVDFVDQNYGHFERWSVDEPGQTNNANGTTSVRSAAIIRVKPGKQAAFDTEWDKLLDPTGTLIVATADDVREEISRLYATGVLEPILINGHLVTHRNRLQDLILQIMDELRNRGVTPPDSVVAEHRVRVVYDPDENGQVGWGLAASAPKAFDLEVQPPYAGFFLRPDELRLWVNAKPSVAHQAKYSIWSGSLLTYNTLRASVRHELVHISQHRNIYGQAQAVLDAANLEGDPGYFTNETITLKVTGPVWGFVRNLEAPAYEFMSDGRDTGYESLPLAYQATIDQTCGWVRCADPAVDIMLAFQIAQITEDDDGLLDVVAVDDSDLSSAQLKSWFRPFD